MRKDLASVLRDEVVQGIEEWAKHERTHNPGFSLVVGSKAYNIDQIVDHVKNGTEDGETLMRMIARGAVALFTRYRK